MTGRRYWTVSILNISQFVTKISLKLEKIQKNGYSKKNDAIQSIQRAFSVKIIGKCAMFVKYSVTTEKLFT